MNPVHILLIDDHPLVRDGLRARLQLADTLQVVGEAGDGGSALALAAATPADLALVDISMPDMTGIELTRRLREMHPHLRIRSSACTTTPNTSAVRCGPARAATY
jgi:two-component system, NarL family, nitrate/nitrite response regulator NarL